MPPSLQSVARCLLPAILFGLSACAGVPREPPAPTPPPVPAVTWESVDRELLLAARTASAYAGAYAEAGLDLWLGRVRRYTDETFVPWYTSYWTQEWLAVKFAWYQSEETNGEAEAERRLAAYLQEKYQAQVLEPASEVADPGRLLHQATALYLFTFAEQANAIGRRYRLAEPVYREHLTRIPAIPGGDGEAGLALGPLLAAARPDRLPPTRYSLPNNERHILALHYSRNCVDWCMAGVVARGETPQQARHYASMCFDGDNLHVLSRSGDHRARSAHDGNLITFHTVKDFRELVYI